MIIDTHAHLNFSAYRHDADEVIHRSLDNDVWMINVGSQYSTSKRAVEIAEKYKEGVFAAIGLHPIYAKDKFLYEKYQELAKSKKVVAVGETGLDYKSEYISFKQEQKDVFKKQIDLVKELNLPIIFHCRQAHDDLISILKAHSGAILRGVVHCFTGTWEQAQKYLDIGFYLGFNGIIFKLDLNEIIKKTPLDRILIETDCPYLTPPQKQGRNEPLFVKYAAEKIAEVKGQSYEEITKITFQNAKKLFKL